MAPPVTLHVHGALAFFVDVREEATVTVPAPRPRSAKDAIESTGIPHPEVDLLLVDGMSASFDALLHGGEHVDVFPPGDADPCDAASGARNPDAGPWISHVRPPAPPHRFACDVHLGRLARKLRLLGLDTWYRTEANDDELAAVAVEQDRVLLTRDRGLLMRRVITHGYCPRSDHPREQVLEVLRRYQLGERLRPLSRCARCNGVLESVAKIEIIDQLPPHTRSEHDQFSRCTTCGRVYWPGSHMRHIEAFVHHAHLAGRSP